MGVLDFFYNLGGQVGRAAYQAGASVTAPSPTPPQTVAPPVLAAQANPVTQATQTYTERYSYTTSGSTAVPRPQVTSPILSAQPIQSSPAAPIVRNELMGLPAPFRSQPTPIVSTPVIQEGQTKGDLGLPRPFLAQPTTITIQQPTGELPVVGKVPIVSPVIAFFQQPKETKTVLKNLPGTSETVIGKPYSEIKDLGGGVIETTTYTPSTTTRTGGATLTTTTAPLPSAFERFEKGASEKVYSVLPAPMKPMLRWGEIQIEKAGLQPSDVTPSALITRPENILFKSTVVPAAGITYGATKGIAEKPITTVAAIGMGAIFGVGFKALEYGGAVGAGAAISQFPRATAALTALNVEVLPTVLGGFYAVDVALRSSDYMRAGPAKTSLSLGRTLGTETIPMGIGFGIGHEIPGKVYRGAEALKTDVKIFQQETGEGAFGYSKASARAAVELPAKTIQPKVEAFKSYMQYEFGQSPETISGKARYALGRAGLVEQMSAIKLEAAPSIKPTQLYARYTEPGMEGLGKSFDWESRIGTRAEAMRTSMGLGVSSGQPLPSEAGEIYGGISSTQAPRGFRGASTAIGMPQIESPSISKGIMGTRWRQWDIETPLESYTKLKSVPSRSTAGARVMKWGMEEPSLLGKEGGAGLRGGGLGGTVKSPKADVFGKGGTSVLDFRTPSTGLREPSQLPQMESGAPTPSYAQRRVRFVEETDFYSYGRGSLPKGMERPAPIESGIKSIPISESARMPAIISGISYFQTQVPKTSVQTSNLISEITTVQSQKQAARQKIEPALALTPALQFQQATTTKPITLQSVTQRGVQITAISFDIMQGQRQQNIQQQARISREYQFFRTPQITKEQQEFRIFDRVETRQTTEQSTRIIKTTDITKIIIPGLPYMPSGSDIGRRMGRGKSPFRETIGIKSMLAGITKGIPKMKKGRMKKI